MSFSVNSKTLDFLITSDKNFDTRFLMTTDMNLDIDWDAYEIKINVKLCLEGFRGVQKS